MKRPVAAAAVLGCLNAAVASVTLVLLDAAIPDEFGWFAYAPLNDVGAQDADFVPDVGFPWHYVVVPLTLLLMNVVVVTAYLHRTERR